MIRHPEISQSDIAMCINSPDEIYYDKDSLYHVLLKKMNDKWICCIIDKLNSECIVVSAWYMNEYKKNRYVSLKLAMKRWVLKFKC